MPKTTVIKKVSAKHVISAVYWFVIGFILAGAVLASLVLFYFQYSYRNRVIPGVFVNNVYVGEQNGDQIKKIFDEKNEIIGKSTFVLDAGEQEATISAKSLNAGYDTDLIISQAMNLGKSNNLPSDVFIILSSYINGTFLSSPYTFNSKALEISLIPIQTKIHKEPIDAKFDLQNNRVISFRQSVNGQDVDLSHLESSIRKTIPKIASSKTPSIININVPIKITEPETTTEEVNKYGITEQIGEGHSTFYGSIPNRVFNVAHATSKINGILVPPGEEFSFVKTVGDISKLTGYKEAYIISGGKTILGDGGGVCQVSTTLFRALLNAGLPIIERNQHAYRVSYYEQDNRAGVDAAIYVPSVDLKFKNDTGHHILIQGIVDTTNLSLSFVLYGTRDGRKSEISTPIVSNVAPAPPDLYQDDPNLPVGTVKQVDFAAPGARTVFTRTVTRGGKVIIKDTFTSNYKPWQAIYLRGTKT